MAPGSAKVTNSSRNPSALQIAREPTNRSSRRRHRQALFRAPPLIATSRRLLARRRSLAGTAPVTASPTARPVMVGSRCLRKGVVGAGGDPGDRHAAAFGDDDAMRPVAAQDDDCRDALRRMSRAAWALSTACPVTFMSRKSSAGKRASPALRARSMARATWCRMPRVFRHHHHVADAGRGKPGQHAQDDVGAVGDLQAAGMGDDPAYVARRYRIGDDADNRSGHALLSSQDLERNRQAPRPCGTMPPFNRLGKVCHWDCLPATRDGDCPLGQ